MIGVRPHQIAEGSLVRDLPQPINHPHLVDGLDIRRQTTVDAEDLPLDYRAEWEVVKEVRGVAPDVCVPVLPQDLFVKAVAWVI